MASSDLMTVLGFITLAQNLLPPELKSVISTLWDTLRRPASQFCVLHVHKTNDANGRANDLYSVCETYLVTSGLCREADKLILSTQSKKEKEIKYKLTDGDAVVDTFEGVTVWWSHSSDKSHNHGGPQGRRRRPQLLERWEKRSDPSLSKHDNMFILKMRKKDKQFVIENYLHHVTSEAAEYKRQRRDIELWRQNHTHWTPRTFKHPSTFQTLAMEPELKAKVKADLDAFRCSEKYFRRVGRPWKRGYLLYGPPGTGKSSMIAAMANYLKYDVYDVELTEVYNNNQLKQLLVNTRSKSIIVIEDIDCSLDLAGKRNVQPQAPNGFRFGGGRGRGRGRGGARSTTSSSAVTLSGLLNSTDGLWSCCNDERILIFTTNHVENIDPALLRPGRMDMHIHLSYCGFESFKSLCVTYLSIDTHPSFDSVKLLLDGGVLITPAQVTQHLFANKNDPTAAMRSLIGELRRLKD